jgi:hypothetical protein
VHADPGDADVDLADLPGVVALAGVSNGLVDFSSVKRKHVGSVELDQSGSGMVSASHPPPLIRW